MAAEPFDFLTESKTGDGAKRVLGTSGVPRRPRRAPIDKTTTLTTSPTSTPFPLNKVGVPPEIRWNIDKAAVSCGALAELARSWVMVGVKAQMDTHHWTWTNLYTGAFDYRTVFNYETFSAICEISAVQ